MNYALQFLLVLPVAIFAGIKVTLQGQMSRRHIRTLADTIWFNVLLFAGIAIMLAVVFPAGRLDGVILGFGLLAGCTTVLAQTFYALAFNSGPVSLTVLIANFSILINTVFSAIVFKEKVYLSQICGIVFLVSSMMLSTSHDHGDAKANRRWLFYSIIVMLAFGVGNSIQKLFWITESSSIPNSDVTFLIVMYLSASLIALVLYAFLAGKKQTSALGFQKSVLLFALAIGASLCFFQKTSMYALANVDGSFYFPTVSGLQSLWITAVGIVLFKDKLSRKQKLGVVCGILCVALMNLRFGPTIQF